MIFKKTVVLGVSTLILGTAASFPVSYGQGFPLDFRQFGFNHFTPSASNHLGSPLGVKALKSQTQNSQAPKSLAQNPPTQNIHLAGTSSKAVPQTPPSPPHSIQQNLAKIPSPIGTSQGIKPSVAGVSHPKTPTASSAALPSTPLHGTAPQAVPAGTHQASVHSKMIFQTVAQKKEILESNSSKLTATHVLSHPRTLAIPVSHRTPQRFTRISTPFKSSPLALGGPEFLETPILQKLSQKTSGISAPPLTEYQGPVMEREKVDYSPKHAMATSSSSKKPSKRPFPFALQSNLKNGAIVLKSGITASLSEIDVTLGKAKIIDLPSPAARIAISDPSIAAAVVISPTQIQLIGKSVGVANLMVWNDTESSRYSIIDISVNRDVSVLAKQLKYLDPGIHVEPLASNNSVVLSGEANTRESAQMALEIAKSFFGSGGGASGSPAPSAVPSASAPSSSGGAAAPALPTSAGSGSTISSIAPGSSLPNSSPRILNMIKVKGNPSTKLELAQQKLKEIDPNIVIDIVPGNGGVEKVILTGRVATAGAISKAINTAGIFFGQPGLKVITGPGGKMIRPNGTGEFQSPNAFNDNLDINVLQGSIVTDATGNVISMMEVAQKPQIRCSVRFLNVQTTALRQLGTSFQISGRDLNLASFSGSQIPLTGKTITLPSGGANVSTLTTRTFDPRNNGNPVYAASSVMTSTYNVAQTLGGGITQAFSVNKLFLGALSALEEKRKLKSLAEPTLTLLSGEKASFLAGGEVPIPVLGTNGQITITYHEFGIRLNIIATVTDDGKIHMQVAPEVSTVDPTNSITTNLVTVPGFATRRMQTTLEMADGETFILAGLFSQEEADALSRFPGLGNLPVIGAALTGRNSDRRKNEMIVLIKPEIVTTQGGDGLGFSGAAANITKELSKGTGLKEVDPKDAKK